MNALEQLHVDLEVEGHLTLLLLRLKLLSLLLGSGEALGDKLSVALVLANLSQEVT